MDDRTTIASGLYLAFTADALRRRINPPRDECLDAMKQAVEEADMLLAELRRTAPTPPKPPTRTFREMSDHPDTRRNVLVVPRDGSDDYAIVAWWEHNAGKWICPCGHDNLLIAGKGLWTEIPRPTEGE